MLTGKQALTQGTRSLNGNEQPPKTPNPRQRTDGNAHSVRVSVPSRRLEEPSGRGSHQQTRRSPTKWLLGAPQERRTHTVSTSGTKKPFLRRQGRPAPQLLLPPGPPVRPTAVSPHSPRPAVPCRAQHRAHRSPPPPHTPPPQAHKGERETVEKERAPLIPPARPLRKGSAHRRRTAPRTTPGGAAVRGAGAAAELARLCACSEGGGAAVQGGGTAGAGG